VFQLLISHNQDIKQLVEKGFAVAFDNNYLIIRDIPYLDSNLKVQIGAIVTKVNFIDQVRIEQEDHQIFFAGTEPYNIDGNPIPNLGGGPTHLVLSESCKDIVVQRSFSNKPTRDGKYRDFYEKIDSYVVIISGPAIELTTVSPYTFRVVEQIEPDPIFKYRDTLTSRAEITDLSSKLRNDVIAVIGLGGTGAYLLDFLVKTPVKEIRAFDFDHFHVHNAFRSPGKLDDHELGESKVSVYKSRYDNFRNGLSFIPKNLDSSCEEDLAGVTFAFVCVDKGTSRKEIFDLLLAKEIPFIDLGMGLARNDSSLNGMIRTTIFTRENGQKVRDKQLVQVSDISDDLYKSNIQISELNALNACFAIIRFKQLRGFYMEELPYYNLVFEICDIKVVGESNVDED
jgi:hypothetical protein